MTRRDSQSRAGRLGRLADLARAEERRAASELGRLTTELERQRGQLGELHAYRESYSERTRSVGAGSSVHWKDYQDFCHRLDKAVVAQRDVVSVAEQNVDAARRRWMQLRQRLDSLARVAEQAEHTERQQHDRREQKAIDDLVRPSRGHFDSDAG